MVRCLLHCQVLDSMVNLSLPLLFIEVSVLYVLNLFLRKFPELILHCTMKQDTLGTWNWIRSRSELRLPMKNQLTETRCLVILKTDPIIYSGRPSVIISHTQDIVMLKWWALIRKKLRTTVSHWTFKQKPLVDWSGLYVWYYVI